MNALEVKNLIKRYPAFTLDWVSFCVEEGKIVGLIGRNGAGKSTTIKALLNLISSEGEISCFGLPVRQRENDWKKLVGYVGGGFRFYPQKRAGAIAKTVAAFYPDWNGEKYRALLKTFGLDEHKRIAEFSEGMKVKFALALALSHGARLLIMDEPTSGLDPLSREEVCDLILRLVREEGVTVLFSTHITSDLTRIADRIVYLSEGRVLADEELETLLNGYSVAAVNREEDAPNGIIGLKRVKNGFEGLIKRGESVIGGNVREATLDEIMIHLETERRANQ